MVITISRASNGDAIIRCHNKKFIEKNKTDEMKFPVGYLLTVMSAMSDWCNNELKEECLFDVE